jgi:hypothetical protein
MWRFPEGCVAGKAKIKGAVSFRVKSICIQCIVIKLKAFFVLRSDMPDYGAFSRL